MHFNIKYDIKGVQTYPDEAQLVNDRCICIDNIIVSYLFSKMLKDKFPGDQNENLHPTHFTRVIAYILDSFGADKTFILTKDIEQLFCLHPYLYGERAQALGNVWIPQSWVSKPLIKKDNV